MSRMGDKPYAEQESAMLRGQLAEAFYPCLPRGLVDEWHRLNLATAEIRRDREAPARELLRLSVEGADMNVEPCFRFGAVIEGTDCKVQAVWHLTDDGRRWLPRLEYVREVQEVEDAEDANTGRKRSTSRAGVSERTGRDRGRDADGTINGGSTGGD